MKQFNNPLAPRTNRITLKSKEIKAWVRTALDHPEGTSISVIELACRDEGCPDIETVIGVLEAGKPIQTIKIHLEMAEVTHKDIDDAVKTIIII